jgi:phage shock protein PspC (stress-responsive transcriptional regulator)
MGGLAMSELIFIFFFFSGVIVWGFVLYVIFKIMMEK